MAVSWPGPRFVSRIRPPTAMQTDCQGGPPADASIVWITAPRQAKPSLGCAVPGAAGVDIESPGEACAAPGLSCTDFDPSEPQAAAAIVANARAVTGMRRRSERLRMSIS